MTTLEASGAGSFREALEDRRPRLIVFEVGGVIDLDGKSLLVRNPYLTVAGQTAPDPGITLIRGGLIVETHDVTIQHLGVRPGDRSVGAPDALGTHRGSAGPVHHVIFDHCSATWGIDENLSASGPADVDSSKDPDATSHDITLRNCLIAEGLSHANHPKGEHSKGTLIHDGVRNVVITGCVYAHNRERNPRLKGGTTSTISGNVMYNWGSACIGIGSRGNQRTLQPAEALITDNVAIPGPDTRFRAMIKNVDPGGRATLRNNDITDREHLLPLLRAGSRPARRDPIDARIVRSIVDGTGRIIDSQEQVGGYPVRPATRRALVVPDDLLERQRWLDALSRELSEDKTLDLVPLMKRLHHRGTESTETFVSSVPLW
ncbi:MAG TPA: right-handed parallel beta-helix repeat-containing protein [Thermoanaerobaculia bacterium]